MNVVLLAAGRGSRLGELTRDRPKCLVPLLGRPLLAWLLDSLHAAGLKRISVVSGYAAVQLEGYGDCRLRNHRWQETNMVASLCCAGEVLRQGDTLVSYTDILYTPETIRRLMQARGPIALAYDPDWRPLWLRRFVDPLDDAEQFRLDQEGNVTAIGGRLGALAEAEGQYMGLLKFTPQGWKHVEDVLATIPPATADRLDMTALLSILLERGLGPIQGVPAAGGWCEVDRISDVPIAEEFIRRELTQNDR